MAIATEFKRTLLESIKTDTFKVALYTSSSTIDENTTVYTTTNEISATGYTAGGVVLSNASVDVDGEAGYALNFDTHTFTNCDIVARKAAIYDVTKGNQVVSVIDFEMDRGVVGSGNFSLKPIVRFP